MFGGYHWAYLTGDFVIGFPVWLAFFYYRADLRREMLIAGILLGVFGMVAEYWYLRDYWHPEELNRVRTSLGDLFYGFFLGGVASVAYEAVFRKRYLKHKNRRHHWSWFVLPVIVLGFFVFDVQFRLGINSIYSSIIASLAIAAVILIFRKDLLLDALASSLLFGIVTFLGYILFLSLFPGIVNSWWYMKNISGVLLLGIPIEELFFALCTGMAIGPAYEFFAGLEFKKRKY